MERGAVIMGAVICYVREACKLIDMDVNNMVVLTTINKENFLHEVPKRIMKQQGKELIEQAEDIFYQDNDFFGVLSLRGVVKNKDIIHNILFPQVKNTDVKTYLNI